MDSVCLQRIKNWARDDLDMKITNSELEKICNHFGGARKLFEKLQEFGIQTLTYLPILLNNYQECPLTFPNKRTPEGADSLLSSLQDNVTENPVFKNDISFIKMFNEAIADNFGHFSKHEKLLRLNENSPLFITEEQRLHQNFTIKANNFYF